MLRRLFIKITSTKQFKSYAVGSQIKFWHWADREWTTGTIIEIKTVDNYFMCLRIRYFKNIEVEIFREDWLQNAVGTIKP